MVVRLLTLVALITLVPRAVAVPTKKAQSVQMQFTFVHFKNERVRMTVDGRFVFDRIVPAADANWPNGFTAFAQIMLPACSNIVVTTSRQRVAQRFCRTGKTKSVVVSGGPPLTITAKDQYQGLD